MQTLLPDGTVGTGNDILARWYLTPFLEYITINQRFIPQPVPIGIAEERRHPVSGR
jgi:hypothetical protein